MNSNAISLAVKGLKSAYDNYSDYRDRKAAELYDTMQETKKVAAAQNEAARDTASAQAEDVKGKVSDAREQFAEQTGRLANKVEKKSKQAKKNAKLKGKKTRCKTRCEAKKAEKKAKKAHKDLEVCTQKAIDKVAGKKEQRAKNGRIATASLVLAVIAATVDIIIWKLRKDDKLPADPAPYQQKAETFKTRIEDKTAEVKETVERKASEAEEKAEEVKDRAAGKADKAKDKVTEAEETTEEKATEASKQAQIKVNEVKTERRNTGDAKRISSKSSKPALKPDQARKK